MNDRILAHYGLPGFNAITPHFRCKIKRKNLVLGMTNMLYDKLKPIFFNIHILIALIVFVGNFYAIFCVETLLLDDNARYYQVGQGQFPFFLSTRSFFLPYTEWFFWKLLYVSPPLARGIHVLFIMIPLSVVFYIIFNKYLRLPKSISFAASVLPNIIPMQLYIPAFVNGCYTVYGLLYAICILIYCLTFIKSSRLQVCYIVCPLAIFGASQLMTQSIFLFPPFSILIIFSCGKLSRKLTVLLSFFGTFIFKYIWIKNNPVGVVNKPVELGIDQIAQRLNHFFEYTSILKINLSFLYVIIIIITFALISFVFYIKKPTKLFPVKRPFPRYSNPVNVIILYAFLISWIICTSYVFLMQSKYFPSRYLHISSFGVNCLLLLSIFSLFSLLKSKFLFKYLALTFVLFSLVSRFCNLKDHFEPTNGQYRFLTSSLRPIEFPKDSQLFIAYHHYGTAGYWMWGTGYLQFITRRNDITGHFYKEFAYFDGFEKDHSYSPQKVVRGFDLQKPFFAYRVDTRKQSLIPVNYMLRWLENNDNSEWILYKITNDGALFEITNGKGVDDYAKFFADSHNKHIVKNDILWGGCPSKVTIERLDLSQMQIEFLCK